MGGRLPRSPHSRLTFILLFEPGSVYHFCLRLSRVPNILFVQCSSFRPFDHIICTKLIPQSLTMFASQTTLLSLLVAIASVAATPVSPRAAFTLQNGKDAIALNKKFQTLTTKSSCTSGEVACIKDQFAQCVNGKFVTSACGAGLVCRALPLVLSPGTSVTCDTAGK